MTASSRIFRPLVAAGAVVALSGGSLLLLSIPAVAASSTCTVSATPVTFAAGAADSYVVPTDIHVLNVTAIGGAGAAETYDAAVGGQGAQLTTSLSVTPGETLDVAVATAAADAAGGLSGGAASGGAGSNFVGLHSGGGGGASFVRDGGTVLVAAGGGGGAGAASPGGAAAPASSTSVDAATVTSGADGAKGDPDAGGGGGTGGSTVPGTGGVAVPGYGAGNGFDGVGTVGGNSFVNGGFSVGGGGGGGGYAGGGGGGGGGYAGGGGAGSSYSVADYTLARATIAPEIVITAIAAPEFTTAANTTFASGASSTFSVCAASSVPVTLSSTGTLPSGIRFADNGDGTATLAGSTTDAGTFPITITATGAGGTTTQEFTLTVTAAAVVAADPGQSLAATGADATGGVIAGLVLALLGGGAVVLSRILRKKPQAGPSAS